VKKLIQVFLISFAFCEAASVLWVYQANHALYNSIRTAGMPSVPNALAAPGLLQWDTVLFGSIFFTLTAGSFVSLCICVIFAFTGQVRRITEPEKHRIRWLSISIACSGVAAFIVADNTFFHRVRDYLLLPNHAGELMTRFYYTYSPYATNALNFMTDSFVLPQGLSIALDTIVRSLCTLGLLASAPILFFGVLFCLTAGMASTILSPKTADYITMGMVTAAVAATLIYIYPAPRNIEPENLRQLIGASQSRLRVEGFRTIYRDGLATPEFKAALINGAKSPLVTERYWSAMALSGYNDLETRNILITLIQDPSIFTAAAAAKSLAKLSCSAGTIAQLRTLVAQRPEWYVQTTALSQLKKCRP